MPSDRANMIKKGMLPAFLKELNENKTTKEYWDECKAARNTFTTDDVENMKMMCKRGDES